MNEIYEKNLAALKEYQPQSYNNLTKAIQFFEEHPKGNDKEIYDWVPAKNQLSNLFYRSEQKSFEGLVHRTDYMEEAKEVFESAHLESSQFVCFFGSGLGHFPYIFFKHRPLHNFVIYIIEKNPQIFLRSLCVYDFSDMFQSPDVFLSIGDESQIVRQKINHLFQHFTTVSRHLRILATPSALACDPAYFQDIAKSLMKSRDLATFTAGNSVDDCFIGYKNITRNIDHAIHNPGIAHLINKFEGKTIVSVAAGPATEEHWDTLKKIQGKVPIITCDVLLKPMLNRGIVPDIVTAVERVELVAKFFRDVKIPERTMLVGPLVLLPETIEAFQGETYLYNPTVQQARGLGLNFLGAFWPGSSAGNLNVSFAALLGFKNIILVGHNLAYGYDSNRSHIIGTNVGKQDIPLDDDEIKNNPLVITQDETVKVRTQPFWQQFRSQMEVMISYYPNTTFINTAPKGAKIRGTKLMDLKEALHATVTDDFDFYPSRKKIKPELTEEELEQRSSIVVDRLNQGIERLRFWLDKVKFLLRKLDEWKEHIEQKEAQKRHVSLRYLDQALDEVLKIKTEAVNNDQIFYQFAILTLIPVHVTFEREINEMPGNYKDNYELKRDFLLKHKVYFQLWEKWLPQFIKELEDYKASSPLFLKNRSSAEEKFHRASGHNEVDSSI